MKKIIFLISCAFALFATTAVVAPTEATAQVKLVPNAKDSTIDAGTTTFTLGSIRDAVVSYTIYGVKDSGTVAGKYVFQGSNGGTYWEGIDSLTLGNYGVNYKTFTVPRNAAGKPVFDQFRIHCVGSGSNKVKPITLHEHRRS
jgi:hypothetical protein